MKRLLIIVAGLLFLSSCNSEKKEDNAAAQPGESITKTPAETPPAEIGDYKNSAIARNLLAKLSVADMEGYMKDYADNAVYVWNNGDSVAGKKAISDYWTKRRTEIIDSMTYTNEIWLPIKVNKPQSVEAPGSWLIGWFMVSAKYKTGKKMTQWMHMDIHLNNEDKIDRLIQYLDMAPIIKATTK